MFQEQDKREAQLEYSHAMLLRHHDSTQDLEYKQLASVHRMRDDQVRTPSIIAQRTCASGDDSTADLTSPS